jgi:hypothetical protein
MGFPRNHGGMTPLYVVLNGIFPPAAALSFLLASAISGRKLDFDIMIRRKHAGLDSESNGMNTMSR